MAGFWFDGLLDEVTGGHAAPDFSAWAEGRFPFGDLAPFGLSAEREAAFPGLGPAMAPGNPPEGPAPGFAERGQDDAAEAKEQLFDGEQGPPEDTGWRASEFPGVGPNQDSEGDQEPPEGKGWNRVDFPAADKASDNARFNREEDWEPGPPEGVDADAEEEMVMDSLDVVQDTNGSLPDSAQSEFPPEVFSGLDHFPFDAETFPPLASSLPDAATDAHGNPWGGNDFPLGVPFGGGSALPPGLGNPPPFA